MKWFKQIFENWKSNEQLLEEGLRERIIPRHKEVKVEEVDPCVQEPIRAFVRTVQSNPKRFKCLLEGCASPTLENYKWYRRYEMPSYRIKDKELGLEFTATYVNGKLYSVYGVDFEINGWELMYLDKHLRPIFSREKAVKRKERIEAMQYKRLQEASNKREQERREEWRKLYS